jgi:hypothetical protein
VLEVYTKWLKDNGYERLRRGRRAELGRQHRRGDSQGRRRSADNDISIWLDWLGSRGDVDPTDIKPSDVYTNEFNPNA